MSLMLLGCWLAGLGCRLGLEHAANQPLPAHTSDHDPACHRSPSPLPLAPPAPPAPPAGAAAPAELLPVRLEM